MGDGLRNGRSRWDRRACARACRPWYRGHGVPPPQSVSRIIIPPCSKLSCGVQMQYYVAKTVSGGFSATIKRVIESLKAEGFGVLTEIDVKATMKKKLEIGRASGREEG